MTLSKRCVRAALRTKTKFKIENAEDKQKENDKLLNMYVLYCMYLLQNMNKN